MSQINIIDNIFDAPVDDGVAIMDLNHRIYFSLNESGTLIWQGLKEGTSTAEIAKTLCKEYALEYKIAVEEVDEFIGKLREKNLIKQ